MCWRAASPSTPAIRRRRSLHYEAERRERTAAVVARSLQTRSNAVNRAFASADAAAAHIDREWTQERVTQRYDWIYRYDATAAVG